MNESSNIFDVAHGLFFRTLGFHLDAILALLGHLEAPLRPPVVVFLTLWGGFGVPGWPLGQNVRNNARHENGFQMEAFEMVFSVLGVTL